MLCRFFRLSKKPQEGAGRRYYRLVSYPSDVRDVDGDMAAAMRYANTHRYAAVYSVNSGAWTALGNRAEQVLSWHKQGKSGYVVIY